MIDGEKVVADYLRAHPLVDTRVVGKTPESVDESWVLLTQLDSASVQQLRPGHLFEFYLQLDCYASAAGISGSQQREANEIAGAVHDALDALNGANYQAGGVVVSGAQPNKGLRRPDTDLEPARERFISTATVWMHD